MNREMSLSTLVIAILIALFIFECGPEALCVLEGGEPMANAFGMEWCDLDGDRLPSRDEWRLEW